MKNRLPYFTLAATIYMLFGSILVLALFGFTVNTEAYSPPVRLFLEPAGFAFIIWAFIYTGYIALGKYLLQHLSGGSSIGFGTHLNLSISKVNHSE